VGATQTEVSQSTVVQRASCLLLLNSVKWVRSQYRWDRILCFNVHRVWYCWICEVGATQTEVSQSTVVQRASCLLLLNSVKWVRSQYRWDRILCFNVHRVQSTLQRSDRVLFFFFIQFPSTLVHSQSDFLLVSCIDCIRQEVAGTRISLMEPEMLYNSWFITYASLRFSRVNVQRVCLFFSLQR
jgi:hypothetical protein